MASLLQSGLAAAQDPQPAPVPPPAIVTPAPGAPSAGEPGAAAVKAPLLDGGLLDPAWFGPDITFSPKDDIDFAWARPGLDIAGRTIRMVPWEDPVLRKGGRSRKDHAKATELTDSFPSILRGALSEALGGKARVSRDEGDLILKGRVVDAKVGSKAAKWMIGWGAGHAGATWDLKLTDAKTGEVVLAVHHRVLSLTAMSEIQDKLVKWAGSFGAFLAQQALPKK